MSFENLGVYRRVDGLEIAYRTGLLEVLFSSWPQRHSFVLSVNAGASQVLMVASEQSQSAGAFFIPCSDLESKPHRGKTEGRAEISSQASNRAQAGAVAHRQIIHSISL